MRRPLVVVLLLVSTMPLSASLPMLGFRLRAPSITLVWLDSRRMTLLALLGFWLAILASSFAVCRRGSYFSWWGHFSGHVVVELVQVLGDGGSDLFEGLAIPKEHCNVPADCLPTRPGSLVEPIEKLVDGFLFSPSDQHHCPTNAVQAIHDGQQRPRRPTGLVSGYYGVVVSQLQRSGLSSLFC